MIRTEEEQGWKWKQKFAPGTWAIDSSCEFLCLIYGSGLSICSSFDDFACLSFFNFDKIYRSEFSSWNGVFDFYSVFYQVLGIMLFVSDLFSMKSNYANQSRLNCLSQQ